MITDSSCPSPSPGEPPGGGGSGASGQSPGLGTAETGGSSGGVPSPLDGSNLGIGGGPGFAWDDVVSNGEAFVSLGTPASTDGANTEGSADVGTYGGLATG